MAEIMQSCIDLTLASREKRAQKRQVSEKNHAEKTLINQAFQHNLKNN